MIDIHTITDALTMIEQIRDHALQIEIRLREDDPLADFDDAWGLAMALAADRHSPDALEAMLKLLHSMP